MCQALQAWRMAFKAQIVLWGELPEFVLTYNIARNTDPTAEIHQAAFFKWATRKNYLGKLFDVTIGILQNAILDYLLYCFFAHYECVILQRREAHHQREPRLWIDKYCIDQNNIEAGRLDASYFDETWMFACPPPSDKAQGHSRFLFTKLLMISWDSTFKYFRCSSSTVCLHKLNSMKKYSYLTKLMVLPRLQSSTKTTWNSSHPDKLCCKMLQVWPGQFDVPSSLFGLLPHPTDLGWTHIPSSSLVH